MALEPCVDCGHEISTEAKNCPNCGARNRAYKSKIGRYLLITVLLVTAGIFAFFYISYKEYKNNITNCDTPFNRESFVGVIDGSSYSQLHKLRVVDVTNIKTIKTGKSRIDLECNASIHYNSRHKANFRFTWSESESGNMIIRAKELSR